jgi:hypothetical protein
MVTSDRRTYRRLSLRFDMFYRRQGTDAVSSRRGTLQNASAGGICFHMTDDTLEAGTVIDVVLRVPPRHGVLEEGGRVSGRAQVLWSSRQQTESGGRACVVGARFCDRPSVEAG